MNEREIFNAIIATWLMLAAIVFVLLFFIAAPHGRYVRKGWGATINNKMGWIIMESTSSLLFALFFILGNRHGSFVALIFLALWEAHYIHRAFIYPLTLKGSGKRMPVFVVSLGLFFNSVNSYLNGRYLFSLSPVYDISWLSDPRFIVGTALFIAGFMVNCHSDRVLRALRGASDEGYKIPYGGFYRMGFQSELSWRTGDMVWLRYRYLVSPWFDFRCMDSCQPRAQGKGEPHLV